MMLTKALDAFLKFQPQQSDFIKKFYGLFQTVLRFIPSSQTFFSSSRRFCSNSKTLMRIFCHQIKVSLQRKLTLATTCQKRQPAIQIKGRQLAAN